MGGSNVVLVAVPRLECLYLTLFHDNKADQETVENNDNCINPNCYSNPRHDGPC